MKAKSLFPSLPLLTKNKENCIAVGSEWRNNSHFSAFRNRGHNQYPASSFQFLSSDDLSKFHMSCGDLTLL